MTTNPIDPDEMLHSAILQHLMWVYMVSKFMSYLYYISHKGVKKLVLPHSLHAKELNFNSYINILYCQSEDIGGNLFLVKL